MIRWLKDLSVSQTLLGLFLVVALLCGLAGWAGVSGLGRITAQADRVQAQQLASMVELQLVSEHLYHVSAAVQQRVAGTLTAGEALRSVRSSRGAASEAWVSASLALEADSSLRAGVRQLERELLAADSVLDELERVLERGDVSALVRFHARELSPVLTQLQARLVWAEKEQVRLAREGVGATHAIYRSTRQLTWAIVLLAVVVAMGLGWVVSRAITNALGQMREAADRLARGDLDITVTFESKGDVGRLAESFRRMGAAQKAIAEAAAEIAAGNLAVEVEPRSERDVLAQ